MDKKELRKQIRELKRAMTAEQIEAASNRLAQLFYNTDAYQNAKTIYGYLPYNQEVRTVAMLEQAMKDGKRVAVPKCYGDEMKFLYMDDLSQVEKGYAGIPEPIADEHISSIAGGAAITKVRGNHALAERTGCAESVQRSSKECCIG